MSLEHSMAHIPIIIDSWQSSEPTREFHTKFVADHAIFRREDQSRIVELEGPVMQYVASLHDNTPSILEKHRKAPR